MFVGRVTAVGVLAGRTVWVGMAVGGNAVGDAANVGGSGLAVAWRIAVFVGWIVGCIKVAGACGLAGNSVFVGAVVGGTEVAVA